MADYEPPMTWTERVLPTRGQIQFADGAVRGLFWTKTGKLYHMNSAGDWVSAQPDKLTSEGESLTDNYLRAEREVQRAKERLASAEGMLDAATQALGKWIMPPDAASEEKIAM